jgi:superfamily II DNA or RNA helicase
MRRMLKEELVDFDGRPLFPERRAYTVNYELSDDEVLLYEEVTDYVREQMNRAERMAESDDPNTRRRGSILGFALTGLQRRLASSPAAIHESLARRLRRRKQDLDEKRQAGRVQRLTPFELRLRQLEEADLSELPEEEQEEIVAAASADQEIEDLEAEVRALEKLVKFAERVRKSGFDKKWEKLREVLERPEMFDPHGKRRKLVLFTEHRDTLEYLVERVGQLLGGPDRVVAIHGGMLRERRREAQARFIADPNTLVLVATDAAGEGINLQRAHLMINYDLPWNPNRIEQRFGRIHRFGQKETCYVWNLVAYQTREGAVFQRLFEKLEEERKALGGKVFDVLGELFTEVSLRDLMLEAIRASSTAAAREVAAREVDPVFIERLHRAIEERALDAVTLEADRLRRLREQKERAEALRLIPHVVESYFVSAFTRLGGAIQRREPHRYHISNVPATIRQRDRQSSRGLPVQRMYDRICFDRSLVDYPGKPPAVFVAPGNPLFDAVTDLVLEQCRDLLRRGAILVDDDNKQPVPRVLFGVESAIVDGTVTASGRPRELSRRIGYLSVGADGAIFSEGMAPHLEYRALREEESEAARRILEGFQLGRNLEDAAADYGIAHVVAPHLEEVRSRRLELLDRMAAAVRQRLTAEIVYWDRRYADLRQQEAAGKKTRLSSEMARRRRDELEERLERRLREIDQQRNIGALPPIVHAAAFVIPAALLAGPAETPEAEWELRDRRRIEAIAMECVMARERAAGRMPVDVSDQHLGWDIESREPDGSLRFIEVKGRRHDADEVQLSRNERFAARNKGSQYYLAVVLVDGDSVAGYYEQADPLADERDDLIAGVSLDISRMRAGAVELPQ